MARHESTPTSSQTPSPLLELAPELRNEIFELAVVEPDGITIPANGKVKLPAILAVCREVRHEAEGIYFGMNTFRADIGVKRLGPLDWLAKLNSRQRRHIDTLNIHFTQSEALADTYSGMVDIIAGGDTSEAAAANVVANDLRVSELGHAGVLAIALLALDIKFGSFHFEDAAQSTLDGFLDNTNEENLEAKMAAMFGMLARTFAETVLILYKAAYDGEMSGDWSWRVRKEKLRGLGRTLEKAARSGDGVQTFFELDERGVKMCADVSKELEGSLAQMGAFSALSAP